MPSFGSFKDLSGWHAGHVRRTDLGKAIQLAEFGNGREAVALLNRYDLTREALADKRAFAMCYLRGAKEEVVREEWSLAKRSLVHCLNLGQNTWSIQRRVDLLAEIISGRLKPVPATNWFERYRCPCEVCTTSHASLLDSARCCGILHSPCVPIHQSQVDGLYAIGVYRWIGDPDSLNALSRMIRWLKKNEGEETCKYLGWLLVSGLRADTPDFLHEADVLVAVPSDPERTCQRGFDNVAELASWVERFAILPWERDSIKKTIATPDLRQLSWSQRRASIRGSMQVTDSRHIQNATILLIDDVVTSGSTLDYCAELLKAAGASKVYAAVLARSESTLTSDRYRGTHSMS